MESSCVSLSLEVTNSEKDFSYSMEKKINEILVKSRIQIVVLRAV